MGTPARVAVMGLGSRGGAVYADYVRRHPRQARLVAAADPLAYRREETAAAHGLPDGACFTDYRELAAAVPRLGVDAVIVALPDAEHVDAVVRLAPHRRPILMEKPVATTPDGLDTLERAVTGAGCPVAVSHVLRYTPFFRTVRALLDDGALGRVQTIRLEENIGYWHFAHSYVRGNWRREALSSPMILAKSCHDLDVLRWLAGTPPRTVTSVGSLGHFRAEHAPDGAPGHCLDGCPAADSCAFYAPRYYVDALAGVHGPPVSLLGPDTSPDARMEALRTGPYGRCVYHCDNDVADHQQVLVSFADGITATLTTSAFTAANTRTIQVTLSAGEIAGRMDTGALEVHLYSPTARLGELAAEAHKVGESRTGRLRHQTVHLQARPVATSQETSALGGHGGGDDGLLDQFFATLGTGTRGELLTSLEASLDSHRMAFAAERSRQTGTVVDAAGPRRAVRP